MKEEREFRWAGISRTSHVEVYHSGKDEKRIAAPFALVREPHQLPSHPETKAKDRWKYWKRVPLNAIAVNVPEALRSLAEEGFYIQ